MEMKSREVTQNILTILEELKRNKALLQYDKLEIIEKAAINYLKVQGQDNCRNICTALGSANISPEAGINEKHILGHAINNITLSVLRTELEEAMKNEFV